ncbi:MAG TPA: FtsX-like permease family protein, partial [Actinomycetota bacterium]|nr:FtsX-like permease family protein [Actinomycetota bacterium]
STKVLDESLEAEFTVASGGFIPSFISPQVSADIAKLPEVDVVSPVRIGQFRTEDENSSFVVGIDPAALGAVTDIDVTEGSLASLGAGELLMFGDVADELGLEVGDRFPMEFASTGEEEVRVAGLFDNKSLVQADYLMAMPTYETYFPEKVDVQVFVKVAEGVRLAEAREEIEQILERYPALELQDQAETKESQAAQVNQLLGMVTVMLALAVFIALFGITNTLALSVFERTRELGLLRAVGMSRRQTRRMIRWEAVIISVIGAVLGLAIGIFFGWALVKSLEGEGITELVIPYFQLSIYVFFAAVAGVLAAIFPARRAARLNVLEAISTE